MRFGHFLPQGWRLDLVGIPAAAQWPLIRDLARRADAGPWDSVWVYDHFHTAPAPTTEATHEAWSLMAALAATTDRVKLGQMCTAMGYRNPAYLAKVAATCDAISGGRVQVGIGAGWYEHEWRAYGYGFPPARERLGRLAEGAEILRQAWTTGSATLEGTYYQVDGAVVRPRPAAQIPMWIAGGGERKTLRIAAEYAQYTNFDGTDEGFAHKSEVLRGHCTDLGRDFDSITRTANYNVIIAQTDAQVQCRLDDLQARLTELVPAQAAAAELGAYRGMPAVGTPDQVVANLLRLRALGLGYAVCYFPDAGRTAESLELFEREVIPALS